MRALYIFVVALVVRSATAAWISQPGYMDSYYYYIIAKGLHSGRGLVEDFVWNYLTVPNNIPHDGNLYWMPLASIVMAFSFFVFDDGFRAAQVPMILFSSILPVLSYRITRDLLGNERHALGAAVLTIFSGVYFVYWIVPESFGLFAVLGALCLYFTAKGVSGYNRSFIPAGLVAGLAQLTRGDGVLLAGIVFVFALGTAWKDRTSSQVRRSFLPALAAMLAYLAVLSPWLWRNYLAFGEFFPSSSLKAAFLREYNDMFAYGYTVDLAYYLSSGWADILQSKASALANNFWTLDAMVLVYLLPLVVLGWWHLRFRADLRPALLYAVALYFVASLVFTYPGPRGMFLHSGAALLPFLFGPALVGLDRAVAFAARFLRHWSVPRAQANFTYILVGFSAILSVLLAARALQGWNDHHELYEQIAYRIESRLAEGQAVMVVDPPAYYYLTERPSVVFTNDGLPKLVDLATRYGVGYVVLEPAYPKPLHDFYQGTDSHPALELEESFPDRGGKLVKIYRVLPQTASTTFQ